MPHVDVTLGEIEYAYDTLKVDGVAFYTNYGDKWLGDQTFNPVFEELNRRKAVVFTHPITADCCKNLITGIGDGAIEWQTDTTRAIAQLMFGGSQERYPNVRIIFSHGGGTMPFLVDRFTAMAKSPKYAAKFPQGFAGTAAKFYYDTAQVSNPPAMSALTKAVPTSQILFGTDYPARTLAEHVRGLKECGVVTPIGTCMVSPEGACAAYYNFGQLRPRNGAALGPARLEPHHWLRGTSKSTSARHTSRGSTPSSMAWAAVRPPKPVSTWSTSRDAPRTGPNWPSTSS